MRLFSCFKNKIIIIYHNHTKHVNISTGFNYQMKPATHILPRQLVMHDNYGCHRKQPHSVAEKTCIAVTEFHTC